MPILWRYLIRDYLKIVLLSMAAFLVLLLTMRLDDIAHFAALGAPWDLVLSFALHQIPYILPVALPLSCLIASWLLADRLSSSDELTTLRSSGVGLATLLAPLLFTAALLSIGNFLLVSEVATASHLQSHWLKAEVRALNPLLLLNNKQLLRLKGIFFEARGPSHLGEYATDTVLAIPYPRKQQILLSLAKEMRVSSLQFSQKGLSLVSYLPSGDLMVENSQDFSSSTPDLRPFLQKMSWSLQNDYLGFPSLLQRLYAQKKEWKENPEEKPPQELRKIFYGTIGEVAKRFCLALAPFSFSLLGLACGLKIGRKPSWTGLGWTVGLTALFLVAFFTAKEMDKKLGIMLALYFFPHFLIVSISLRQLSRLNRGIET